MFIAAMIRIIEVFFWPIRMSLSQFNFFTGLLTSV